MKRLCLHLRTFLLLIWLLIRGGDGYRCPYGQHCLYEPAPPGRTPPCAQPGLTYCLHTDPYPEQLIRHLIEAGRYDIRTLLSDETRDDFSENKKTEYPYSYGPKSLHNVDQISLVNDPTYPKNYNTKLHTRFNHEIFNQKTPLQPPSPIDPTPYNLNAYQTPNFTKLGFNGYHSNAPNPYWNPAHNQFDNDYDKKVYKQNNQGNLGDYNQNFFNPSDFYPNYDSSDWFRQGSNGVTQYNPNEWWRYVSPSRSDVTVERSVTFPTRTVRRRRRRNADLVKAAQERKLTGSEALRIALGLSDTETTAERPRRQAGGAQGLCSERTEFVTPQAALNVRGDWKYVVNMPDNMTQLVRSVICASRECNGLCMPPPGYSTNCEQKFLQRRLVALQPNGQNLYTDIFWIPSCCQCIISPTN